MCKSFPLVLVSFWCEPIRTSFYFSLIYIIYCMSYVTAVLMMNKTLIAALIPPRQSPNDAGAFLIVSVVAGSAHPLPPKKPSPPPSLLLSTSPTLSFSTTDPAAADQKSKTILMTARLSSNFTIPLLLPWNLNRLLQCWFKRRLVRLHHPIPFPLLLAPSVRNGKAFNHFVFSLYLF